MKLLGQNIIPKEREVVKSIAHLNVSPITKLKLTKHYYKICLRANN